MCAYSNRPIRRQYVVSTRRNSPTSSIPVLPSQQPIPRWIVLWSQLLSIPFGIASVALAIIAIVLTVRSTHQREEMDHLKKVINQLVVSNGELKESNRELKAISKQSFETVEGVAKLQELYFEQNRTTQVNTEPAVKFTGTFDFQEYGNKILHFAGITNDGQRDATKLSGVISSLYYTGKASTVIMESPIEPEDLKPRATAVFVDTLNMTKADLIATSRVIVFRYEFHYSDPLTNKSKTSYEYFTHTLDGLKVKYSPSLMLKAKVAVDKAITESRRLRGVK